MHLSVGEFTSAMLTVYIKLRTIRYESKLYKNKILLFHTYCYLLLASFDEGARDFSSTHLEDDWCLPIVVNITMDIIIVTIIYPLTFIRNIYDIWFIDIITNNTRSLICACCRGVLWWHWSWCIIQVISAPPLSPILTLTDDYPRNQPILSLP